MQFVRTVCDLVHWFRMSCLLCPLTPICHSVWTEMHMTGSTTRSSCLCCSGRAIHWRAKGQRCVRGGGGETVHSCVCVRVCMHVCVHVIVCMHVCECGAVFTISLQPEALPLSCHSVVTQLPLSCHSVVTQLPLSCHSAVTQLSLSYHSVVTQLSLSCHSVVTQLSLSCHSVVTQLPLMSPSVSFLPLPSPPVLPSARRWNHR